MDTIRSYVSSFTSYPSKRRRSGKWDGDRCQRRAFPRRGPSSNYDDPNDSDGTYDSNRSQKQRQVFWASQINRKELERLLRSKSDNNYKLEVSIAFSLRVPFFFSFLFCAFPFVILQNLLAGLQKTLRLPPRPPGFCEPAKLIRLIDYLQICHAMVGHAAFGEGDQVLGALTPESMLMEATRLGQMPGYRSSCFQFCRMSAQVWLCSHGHFPRGRIDAGVGSQESCGTGGLVLKCIDGV